MILAAIVIVFGSVAYYYSSNLTNTVTNNYVQTASNSQQAVAERIGFEYVQHTSSALTVYIINCGNANNIQINSVFIYDSSNNIQGVYSGSPSPISYLYTIGGNTLINGNGQSLNIGQEAYFTVTLSGASLNTGSPYTLQLVTKSGSNFDYDFTA
jgi:hypothetical protein